LAHVRFDLVTTVSYNLFNFIVMKRKDIFTLIFLIFLTISTAFFSINYYDFKYIGLLILFLSGLKFVAVIFQFMEMKKAHAFWKAFIIIFLVAFIATISMLL